MTILAAFNADTLVDLDSYETEDELIDTVMGYISADGRWLYGVVGLTAYTAEGDISDRIMQTAVSIIEEQAAAAREQADHERIEASALRREQIA